jgi:hypothetical protein
MGTVGLEGPRGAATQEPVRENIKPGLRSQVVAFLASEAGIVLSLAVAACALHFLVNLLIAPRYGYFRDELYYAACGEHLAWGYVDQAPLIAVIARLTRWLLGDSLFALRFFPALSAAAKVLLAGWMARELGGRRYAQALAATAVLIAPIYLTFDNLFTMNAFEPVFWMLCAALGLRIVRQERPRLWVLFGLVAGLGLLNKHSMLFFGSGVFVGLLLTPERRFLRSKWIWLGGLLSFAVALPNIVWEALHAWPTLEILQFVGKMKNVPVSPLGFILEQALLVHPLAAPICLAGLYFFLRAKHGKPYRFLGWAYLIVLLEMLILKGRIYYLAPIYPMLLAAGAVWIEQWICARNWDWLKPVILAPLAVGGIVAAPLALPLLPVEATIAYSNFWDVDRVKVENHDLGRTPQLFSDMFGWENQVAIVARVFHGLPAADQSRCTILASNYGEAGAIDYFGAAYGLPKAISAHNSYYLWGPGNSTSEVVLTLGLPREDLEPLFAEIQQVATINHPYAMPDENNLPVFLCRAPKMTLQQAWPRLKVYN